VRLRISINTGPCIAVRLNSNLDYFGNAVNLAAKLQAVVDAGQIVVSEVTYRAPGVAEHVAARGVEAVTCDVKGIARSAPGWRWTIE
jgi:class 3 adenylate cyclase